MSKLTLDLDSLRVESFDAAPAEVVVEDMSHTLRITGNCMTCYQTC
ncbi:MAG TPA: hypothetical protein VF746_24530 [Longimicrobium sp.]|jgi:hypothetical protein